MFLMIWIEIKIQPLYFYYFHGFESRTGTYVHIYTGTTAVSKFS